ncbi:MAG: hypothetical protein ACLQBY_07105 [Solirubrobacteraceae bacterium]
MIVAICGLAVGAAVGTKGGTKTHTVTVTQTSPAVSNASAITTPSTTASTSSSTASTSSAPSTGTSSTSSTGTSPAAEPPGEGQQYLAEYLAGQGAEKLNGDASEVELSSEAGKEELQGQTYQQAVAFNIGSCCNNRSTFQIPTPGFSRLTSKAVGLETIANAEAFYKLTVYKNNDSSPNSVVLYSATFHGPSEIHKMDFGLQGATDLVFVWTKSSSEPDGQDVFILADPVLSR